MIAGYAWPDIAIAAIVALTTIRGFSRGFIAELAGVVALAAGLIAPRFYNGTLDGWIATTAHLPPADAHLAGAIVTGIGAYAIVLVAAAILGRIARLPILGTGNALAGGIAGAVKGGLYVWVALLIVQFVPLSTPIADALHGSRLASWFVQFDAPVEAAIRKATPDFVTR